MRIILYTNVFYSIVYLHTHTQLTDLTQKLMILNDKELESENQIKLLRPITEGCVQNTPPRRGTPAVRVSCTNLVTFRCFLFPFISSLLRVSATKMFSFVVRSSCPAGRPAGPRVLDAVPSQVHSSVFTGLRPCPGPRGVQGLWDHVLDTIMLACFLVFPVS